MDAPADGGLRPLIDLMPGIVWTTDAELRFTTSLGGGLAALGLRPDETVGSSLAEYFGTADPAFGPIEAHRRALAGERVRFDFEWADRTFEAEVTPLRGADAEVQGTIGVALDVSARSRADRELAESEAQLRLLVEQLPGLLYTTDRELRVTSLRGTRLTERSRAAEETVLGRTVAELTDGSEAAIRAHRRCLDGTPATFQLEREGLALETRLEPLRDPSGAVIGCVGLTVDVSTRSRQHEAAEWLAAIVESSTDAVIGLGLDGTTLSWNAGAEAVYGWTAEEAVGRSIDMVVPPERKSEGRRLLDSALSGERVELFETQRLRKDGTYVDVLLSVAPVRNASGSLAGVSVIARDIGQRKRLEAQLGQAQKLEAVGRLAGGVAHDFNNILTALRMYAELAAAHAESGDLVRLREEIQGIESAVAQASSIVRQLLALGRRQLLQPALLDLNELVRDSERLLRRLIGEDIEIEVSLEPELGSVEVDRGQFEQVILNLAVNARDAMPGGGRLRIATASADGAEPAVTLTVSDTGVGMDDAARAQAFEPFFTTKEDGTGLGLATVYGIVVQSGGEIRLESEPGRGTTVAISLPTVAAASPARANGLPVPPAGGTETILLVEDDDGVRALVFDALASRGYVVHQADSPATALELLERLDRVDLLLTDVVMPGMSGRELAERVVAARPATQVLYMSGYTNDAVLRGGGLDPDTAFIQKPFTAAELRREVRSLFDGQRRTRT